MDHKYLYPIITIFVTLIILTLYKIKKHKFVSSHIAVKRPEIGDIFFTIKKNDTIDILDTICRKSLLTLHTKIPFGHVGIFISDSHVTHQQIPSNKHPDEPLVEHYEDLFNRKDDENRMYYIIKTNIHRSVTPDNKHGYWLNGGCLGYLNSYLKNINKIHYYCYSVEDFCEQYNGKIYRLF